ncbi:MAG: hypothetical protein HUJ80_09410 [Firmicutes bacterium]|nr:hypothetical protein [Bacillota bacterium]
MDKQQLRDILLGALIGLARASEGQPSLPSSVADACIRGLTACGNIENVSELQLKSLISQVRGQKHLLAPDCSTCAAPCGRTADYDMKQLAGLSEPVRAAKTALLQAVMKAAQSKAPSSPALDVYLLEGLFKVGYYTEDAAWLKACADKAEQFLPSLK